MRGQLREATRVSPSAVFLEDEVNDGRLRCILKFCKLLKIVQLTIEASPKVPLSTAEIDRLRERAALCHQEGVRLSILTKTGLLSEDPHTAVELCQSVKGSGSHSTQLLYLSPGWKVDFDVVYNHVLHAHLRDTSPKEIQVPAVSAKSTTTRS